MKILALIIIYAAWFTFAFFVAPSLITMLNLPVAVFFALFGGFVFGFLMGLANEKIK